MRFHLAGDNAIPYATLLLVGDSGAGKTLLASQMPDAFFLDIESGAHHTGCPRITFDRTGASYNEVINLLKGLARIKPSEDGLLHWKPSGAPQEFAIGTLVIDSVDELQGIVGKTITVTGHRYWGQMLDKMRKVFDLARCCGCHLVFVAHTREYKPSEEEIKKYQAIPSVGLALQGQVRDKVPNWVDVALNLIVEDDGSKTLISERKIIRGRSYYAKDRYHVFNGETYQIRFDNEGKIKNGILDRILKRCAAGGERPGAEEMLLDHAKQELIARAVVQGILTGRNDAAGMIRLKNLLAEASLTPSDALAKKELCIATIESWAPDPEPEEPFPSPEGIVS